MSNLPTKLDRKQLMTQLDHFNAQAEKIREVSNSLHAFSHKANDTFALLQRFKDSMGCHSMLSAIRTLEMEINLALAEAASNVAQLKQALVSDAGEAAQEATSAEEAEAQDKAGEV